MNLGGTVHRHRQRASARVTRVNEELARLARLPVADAVARDEDAARVGRELAHDHSEGRLGYVVAVEAHMDQVHAVLVGRESDGVAVDVDFLEQAVVQGTGRTDYLSEIDRLVIGYSK